MHKKLSLRGEVFLIFLMKNTFVNRSPQTGDHIHKQIMYRHKINFFNQDRQCDQGYDQEFLIQNNED